jgi:hypothetical protein
VCLQLLCEAVRLILLSMLYPVSDCFPFRKIIISLLWVYTSTVPNFCSPPIYVNRPVSIRVSIPVSVSIASLYSSNNISAVLYSFLPYTFIYFPHNTPDDIYIYIYIYIYIDGGIFNLNFNECDSALFTFRSIIFGSFNNTFT